MILRTASVDSTRALAAVIAGQVRGGDLLVLSGDLGAGKTAFAQGFCEALGVTGPVTSPTFTIAHRYEGRLVVNHVDVYRFESISEVLDLDLAAMLEDDGAVTVVEWGDRIRPALPRDRLELRITLGPGEDDREIELCCIGSRWLARERLLAELLAAWEGEQPGSAGRC